MRQELLAPFYAYHLIWEVPRRINAEANKPLAPPRTTIEVPLFWDHGTQASIPPVVTQPQTDQDMREQYIEMAHQARILAHDILTLAQERQEGEKAFPEDKDIGTPGRPNVVCMQRQGYCQQTANMYMVNYRAICERLLDNLEKSQLPEIQHFKPSCIVGPNEAKASILKNRSSILVDVATRLRQLATQGNSIPRCNEVSICGFSQRRRFNNLFQQLLKSLILGCFFELRLSFFPALVVLFLLCYHPASWQVRISHVKRFPATDPSTS